MMWKNQAVVSLVILVLVAVSAAAESPPAGLSAIEWRQITSAIELERAGFDVGPETKSTDSLFALDQKLGPMSAYPGGEFGFSVAVDGDLAVIGAPWAHRAYVFVREMGTWQLRQMLEGIWDGPASGRYMSYFFGFSVAVDGTTIVVGIPHYGFYRDVGSDEVWGNAFIFEETSPGSWEQTASVLGLMPNSPPHFLEPYLGSWAGTSVGISGDRVIVGAPGMNSERGMCVAVTKSGGSWVFEDFVFSAYPDEGDHFGRALSVFGDTLVVGAPNEQVLLSAEAGRVHVFDGSGGAWTQVADFAAADHDSEDHFGTSVSVVPPLILIGAPDDDHTSGMDAGSAYVFAESGGFWSQSQKLVALDGEADDRFGDGVSLGFGVAVIGAPDDNHGMVDIDAGSAYVFSSIAGTWFQSTKLFAPDAGTSDQFGSSVAIWGSTAVVGSPFEDPGNVTNAGVAHFFEFDGGVWDHDGAVVGARENGDKEFGWSVGVDGDTLVIGVRDTGLIFVDSGEAYVFRRGAGSWELEWVMRGGTQDFGRAVAVSGDRVVIGIPDADSNEGAARVYTRETGIFGPSWELEAILVASDAQPGDSFGSDVAIDGDTVVVGAPDRGTLSGSPDGAVYVFSRSGTLWLQYPVLESGEPPADIHLGGAVDIDDDVIAAGASADAEGGDGAGAVYVFRRVGGIWSQEQKLLADVPQSLASLGYSVAVDGSSVIAGAPFVDVAGHIAAGAAHIFVETAGLWSEEQQMTAAAPDDDNYFGGSVAISGDITVIGIPNREIHPYGQIGSAEVFFRTGSTWSRHQQLMADVPDQNAKFGLAVAAASDGIVVTAPKEEFSSASPGAVYWFEGSLSEADLAVVIDDGATEVVPGTGVSYHAVVTNAGPDEAMAATVSDAFPPELLGCTWTCVELGGATCTAGPVVGDISDTVDLPVGGRLEYTADCTVAPSATGTLVNTATVTAPPGVADSNLSNNTALDSDNLTPEADLAISKDNGVSEIIEGETTSYTIAVTNPGPSDAPGATVSDTFPPELSGCSWTCAPGAGSACAPSGSGDISDLAEVSAGGGVTYTATCTVAASSGQCSNTAGVTPAAGVLDPNPLDNDDTDTDDVIGLVDVVYVSRILEGEVAVVDVATDAVIRMVDTGSNPAEVGVVGGLGRAFVADLTDGTVTVIDTAEHGVESVIGLGVPVAALAVDEPDQRVYALDYSNGVPGTDLHVIDADTLVELDVFTVGDRTQNIAVSAAEDIAFVSDFDLGIREIDLVTSSVARTLPMTNLPHGLAVDADAALLYVTRIDADSVEVVDTVTLTVIDTLAVGDAPQWIALDPPRAKAFVTNEGDGTVSVIDTAAGTVDPAAIQVGPQPLTITVHEGAAKAYVYNAGDGTISVIDTIGETVVVTLAPIFVDGFETGDTGSWSGTVGS